MQAVALFSSVRFQQRAGLRIKRAMNDVKDATRQFLYSEIGLSLTAERATLGVFLRMTLYFKSFGELPTGEVISFDRLQKRGI